MDKSMFEHIASSLTVKSICGPLGPDVSAGSSIADVVEHLDPGSDQDDPNLDPVNNPSRVIDSDGDVVGMLWFRNYAQTEVEEDAVTVVDTVMERIEPDEVLSSATTILDTVALFGAKRNEYFYVIHVNEVVGILNYNDLFKPLGRLAFLALALEIEDQALRLCQSALIRERCWLSISDNRKCKAIDLFKDRYKREPKLESETSFSDILRLIECTNLADKANMIWKQKLITSATRADVLGFFHSLKMIRDQCAHPGRDGALLPKESLAHFVNSAQRMRSSLGESMHTHGVGSRTELCWPAT